jgi:proteasome assembly chaperone (PAC2) family protein
MKKNAVILKEPHMDQPIMLACWPGMGYVALSVAKYMQKYLKAEEFAIIDADDYFQIPGITIQNGLINPISLPSNTFYFWKSPEKNLVIFISESQPAPGKEYVLAQQVMNVVERYEVNTIFTAAAMPIEISHKDIPSVWAVGSSKEVLNRLNQGGVKLMKDGRISGMNGSLLGMAKQKGIDGICLLGEIPYYTIQIENPKATKAVIEVFCMLTGIVVATTELDQLAQYMEQEVDNYLHLLQEKAKKEPTQTLH